MFFHYMPKYSNVIIISVGTNTISRYLCNVDSGYAALFGESWPALCERAMDITSPEVCDVSARIARYVQNR